MRETVFQMLKEHYEHTGKIMSQEHFAKRVRLYSPNEVEMGVLMFSKYLDKHRRSKAN